MRHAVRVLLMDADDRLLLFRYTADDGERFWCPAGGGVDAGETPEEAARREIAEETGWTGPLDLYEVWHRRCVAPFLGTLYDQRERWFLARVPAFSIDVSGFSEFERETISEWAWWTVGELHQAPERLVPTDLAGRLDTLLRQGPPPVPVAIGR